MKNKLKVLLASVMTLVLVLGLGSKTFADDAGGASGGSGSATGVGAGGVCWTICDDNGAALGWAGTEDNPNVDAVINAIRNCGYIISAEDWGLIGRYADVTSTSAWIRPVLKGAIKQCRENYIKQFGSDKDFKARIVAVGFAFGNVSGQLHYNNTATDVYENDWRDAWNSASKNGGLKLVHNDMEYTVNSSFHNSTSSLTEFALTQLAGNSNIRIIVLDETAPLSGKGNIKIQKKLGATDYDSEINLAGVQFTATLKSDTTKKYVSNVTGTDGVAEIKDIPFGTYTVSETTVPNGALKSDDFEVEVAKNGEVYTFDIIDKAKLMAIAIHKKVVEDAEESKSAYDLSGTVFTVYTDSEAKTPYKDKNGNVVTLTTDANGYAKSKAMKAGTYYLKETVFPKGMDKNAMDTQGSTIYLNKVYKVSADENNTNEVQNIALTVYNKPGTNTKLITKIDAFSGDVVPDCTFVIKEVDSGKEIIKAVTDKEGNAYFSTDLFENGKKYTYTEIDAPEMYNLDTEPHEFTATFDEKGNWATEKITVYNTRKEGRIELSKADFISGERLANCTFELRSLETDFVVTGTTDENGKYKFENIPYGKYTYTELEAPDGYELDTEPHEFTFSEEMVTIEATDKKIPETGDIALVALSAMALVSILGIAFVVIKNKKQLQK